MKHLSDFIHDKDGNVKLIQIPNIPLIAWAVFLVLAKVFGSSTAHRGFSDLSKAALFTWAYLEIKAGESPARRTLGGIVMILLIAGYFHN